MTNNGHEYHTVDNRLNKRLMIASEVTSHVISDRKREVSTATKKHLALAFCQVVYMSEQKSNHVFD